MIPSNKKNYYDLTLCVVDRDDPTKIQVYYPVMNADSVLLKPGGRQNVLHHIQNKTKALHLTDEEKRVLRSTPEHGGLIRLDDNGHIPAKYIHPTMLVFYYEFDNVYDMLANESFKETDYGRLVCVKDSHGDPRIPDADDLNWVIYRITSVDDFHDINSFTRILQKHDMDHTVQWENLDHGFISTPAEIDEMVSVRHDHPSAIKDIKAGPNGTILYKGIPITFRDDIHAVIVTENIDEARAMNEGDIALLVTKVKELIAIDESAIVHEEPFKELSGNHDEEYLGTTGMIHGPKLKTQNMTSCKGFFKNCADLEDYMWYDTSECVDMSYMNQGCSHLKRIPALSFKECENIDYFADSSGIIRFFDIYGDKIKSADYVFNNCTHLKCVDLIDIPNAESTKGFLSGCYSLTMVPRFIDVSGSKDIDEFFDGCSALEYINEIKCGSAITVRNAFRNCSRLVSIYSIDLSSCTDTTDMFKGCSSLQIVGIVPRSLHTNISFANTKLSVNALRKIIKGLNVNTPREIDITNTPAARDLLSVDEGNIAFTGWKLKY